jgi:hypothetical protein
VKRVFGPSTEAIRIFFAVFLQAWIEVVMSGNCTRVIDNESMQKGRKLWACSEVRTNFSFEGSRRRDAKG